MKVSKYAEMERIIDDSPGGVCAVAGPDLYQSGRLVQRAVSRYAAGMDWELVRHSGNELSKGDVGRLAAENSLFSSGRILLISSVDTLGKDPFEELKQAVGKTGDSLMIFLSSEKVPRESAVLRKLQKLVPFYICYEPFQRDLLAWASRLAREEGVQLSRGAVSVLTEYSGRNLSRLAQAVTRLALYHGTGARVDADGIMEVLTGHGGIDVFHLGECVFRNRRGPALDAAWKLLGEGEKPLVLVSYLFGQWKRVLQTRELLDAGADKRKVSRETGARFPLLDKLMLYGRESMRTDSTTVVEAFAEADRGLKTGEDEMVVFADLIFALTSA